MRLQLFVMMMAGTLCVACGGEPEPPLESLLEAPAASTLDPSPLPDVIVAERGGFIPEGVEYDMTNGRLLTGSLTEGSIFQLHEDGQLTTLVSDSDLVSSVGIEADELRDRLLVTNSDRAVFDGGTRGQAMLGAYNLTSGERIAMVDLAAVVTDAPGDAGFFANDVSVSDDGTAYVTDTRMNLIYRVDMNYQASVFHRFDPGAGPNGIVEHPAGYLLVARGAELWKVPLENPATASAVILPEDIPGQDGMVWSAGRLAIVSSPGNRVVALTSPDDWATAELVGVASYEIGATTAAVVGDDVYVVHPTFEGDDPPSVTRVLFE